MVKQETGLPVKGNKKRAEVMLMEQRRTFDPENRPADSHILFADYMEKLLEIIRNSIQKTTYFLYSNMVKGVIAPYLRKKQITLSNLQASDIQDFYTEQLKRVKTSSVIHYHAIIIRHTVTTCNIDGKSVTVAADTTKTKSSMRTLPLAPAFKSKLLEHKQAQEENRRLCECSYRRQYLDYICVDGMGNLIKPGYVTAPFPTFLKKQGLRRIRFHDLRQPYVKATTKFSFLISFLLLKIQV